MPDKKVWLDDIKGITMQRNLNLSAHLRCGLKTGDVRLPSLGPPWGPNLLLHVYGSWIKKEHQILPLMFLTFLFTISEFILDLRRKENKACTCTRVKKV